MLMDQFGISGISIHALAKRATLSGCILGVPYMNFNPRPRKEGDNMLMDQFGISGISIHALAKRATFSRRCKTAL